MIKLIATFLALICLPTMAKTWQDNQAIQQLFTSNNISGTFVVYDVTHNKLIGHNQIRANTRFSPASTFKTPNSLIGLASGAITSVDEKLPYGKTASIDNIGWFVGWLIKDQAIYSFALNIN